MTKREFDRATKQNWRGDYMASDERCSYRESRMREHNGCGAYGPSRAADDYLAGRARYMARLNRDRYSWEPTLATLDVGTRFRAPQRWRAQTGRPLLAGRTI